MVGPSLPAHRILVNDLCSWPGWDIFNRATTTSGAARRRRRRRIGWRWRCGRGRRCFTRRGSSHGKVYRLSAQTDLGLALGIESDSW